MYRRAAGCCEGRCASSLCREVYVWCTGGAAGCCEGGVQVRAVERCIMCVQEELLAAVREVYRYLV